jgi:hypothetical protein
MTTSDAAAGKQQTHRKRLHIWFGNTQIRELGVERNKNKEQQRPGNISHPSLRRQLSFSVRVVREEEDLINGFCNKTLSLHTDTHSQKHEYRERRNSPCGFTKP